MFLQIENIHTGDAVINWIIGTLVILVIALAHRYEKKIETNEANCIARHAESTAEILSNREQINKLHEKIEVIRIDEKAELVKLLSDNTKSLTEITAVISSFKQFMSKKVDV